MYSGYVETALLSSAYVPSLCRALRTRTTFTCIYNGATVRHSGCCGALLKALVIHEREDQASSNERWRGRSLHWTMLLQDLRHLSDDRGG